MKVVILGSEGSMGKRYQAILKYLRIDYVCYDKKLGGDLRVLAHGCDRAIVATPTDTHLKCIYDLMSFFQGSILCEKPVCKNIVEVKNLVDLCKTFNVDLRMMYQYRELYKDDGLIGISSYNYFKSGSDGLIWDCLQIIGLSRGIVHLCDESPLWECQINGQMIRGSLMDNAYIEYVSKWLRAPELCVGPDEIISIHKKVEKFINARS